MQRLVTAAARSSRVVGARSSAVARSIGMQQRSYSGRGPSNALETAYHVLAKRNPTYITFILVGAVTLETIYGGITDSIWAAANNGKTFETADWSKFSSPLDDEDEDDEDDE